MAKPIWQDDFLACYPALLKRLGNIKQIKKVFEVKDLEQLYGDKPNIAPLDGCVYVLLDSISPKDENNNSHEQMLEIGFSVVLAKSLINISPSHVRQGDYTLGQTLTAICKSLQGFEPIQDGEYLTVTPFSQRSGLSIRYDKGFGLFALRFVTEVAILGDN